MKKLFGEVAIGERFSIRKKDWVGNYLKIKLTWVRVQSYWCTTDFDENNVVIMSGPSKGELTYFADSTEVEVED